jgi:hypothetical protein
MKTTKIHGEDGGPPGRDSSLAPPECYAKRLGAASKNYCFRIHYHGESVGIPYVLDIHSVWFRRGFTET